MIAGVLFFAAIRTQAVILFATDDPTANTTAPMGALANSGWQYEGIFGGFLGTPIAAHYFIMAQHIGVQSNVFTYQGSQYDIRQQFDDPASDLRIYRVLQIFPSVAPLYNGIDEIGKHLLVDRPRYAARSRNFSQRNFAGLELGGRRWNHALG
jgi:hypothetical protein